MGKKRVEWGGGVETSEGLPFGSKAIQQSKPHQNHLRSTGCCSI